MNARTPTWAEVARILASRVEWAECGTHRTHEPLCPFCEDVAAWEVYAAKAGVTRSEPMGGSTPVHDLPINPRLVARPGARSNTDGAS